MTTEDQIRVAVHHLETLARLDDESWRTIARCMAVGLAPEPGYLEHVRSIARHRARLEYDIEMLHVLRKQQRVVEHAATLGQVRAKLQEEA